MIYIYIIIYIYIYILYTITSVYGHCIDTSQTSTTLQTRTCLYTLYTILTIVRRLHARLTRALACSVAHARLCAMLSMKKVDIT